jgi:hypothetical protein
VSFEIVTAPWFRAVAIPCSEEKSGPVLAGAVAIDVAAVVVDVAAQLPPLFRSHARIAVRVALLHAGVARGRLLRRRLAARPALSHTLAALLRHRGERGQHNQGNAAQNDPAFHDMLPYARILLRAGERKARSKGIVRASTWLDVPAG